MSALVQLLQTAENLLNRGETAEALRFIGIAKELAGEAGTKQAPYTAEPAAAGEPDAPQSIKDRIREHLGELVGLTAAINVVKDSIDSNVDHARWRVLSDVCERMDELYTALDDVADAAGDAS
jgi:hypothetical protein